MARTYAKAVIQNQLHELGEYFKENYPHYYQEHLDHRKGNGLAGVAIKVMDELKVKCDSLGKALIKSQTELLISNDGEEVRLPPVPSISDLDALADSANTEYRPIRVIDLMDKANSLSPVYIYQQSEEEGPGHSEIAGNVVSIRDGENGEVFISVDIGTEVIELPCERVFVSV